MTRKTPLAQVLMQQGMPAAIALAIDNSIVGADTLEPGGDASGSVVDAVALAASAYEVIGAPLEILDANAVQAVCAQSAIDEVLYSFVLPAGRIGPNSVLSIEPTWTFTGSANDKIIRAKIGPLGGTMTTIWDRTRNNATHVMEAPSLRMLNRGSLNSQIWPFVAGAATGGPSFAVGSNTLPWTTNIDFSQDVEIQICGNRSAAALAAGDAIRFECVVIWHGVND